MNDVDIIITYVDCNDQIWRDQYRKYTNSSVTWERYRSWNNLKYLFRGIEQNMKFVRKVHLVVSHESQVPSWINRNTVNVVFHKDIIPSNRLPTFNSTCIEMFFKNIPDLAENCIYFNDDMFPLNISVKSDFFIKNKIVCVFEILKVKKDLNMFRQQVYNSNIVAETAVRSKIRKSNTFLKPIHSAIPMHKSTMDKVWMLKRSEIGRSLSRVRNRLNLNQYVFPLYDYFKGNCIDNRISFKYLSFDQYSIEAICEEIISGTHKIICINDYKVEDKDFIEFRDKINIAFSEKFPDISKFEVNSKL